MTKIIMQDGWDCDNYSPLRDVLFNYEEMEQLVYELRNCVRTKSLQQMKEELLSFAEGIVQACENIDDDAEIVEEEDEE